MIDYAKIAKEARLGVLNMIYKAQSSHIGSNFSCIDILSVLFEKMDPKKDKFIASKGWVAASVYWFLAQKGIIPKENLERYCQPNEIKYIGLVEPHGVFGLEFAGGSMGYGIAAGVGFALAKKIKKEEGTVYVLASDGEMDCGTTWEAILIAKQYRISNLIVLVDVNTWQATGRTKDILDIEPLNKRIETFCWSVQRINGHDFNQIENALGNLSVDFPNMIVCDTIKGAGVSIFADKLEWHYRNIPDNIYEEAVKELSLLQKIGSERS